MLVPRTASLTLRFPARGMRPSGRPGYRKTKLTAAAHVGRGGGNVRWVEPRDTTFGQLVPWDSWATLARGSGCAR
jgi:hypothetical protein